MNSVRGASSHQHNPFFILARPHTTEDAGMAMGFNLIYSGNFRNRIEVDHYGATRVLSGINPDDFTWVLEPGASFQTPEALVSVSYEGLDVLSDQLSRFTMRHIVNPRFAQSPRPILINNWEATYFTFDEAKLLSIAERARSVGIELFVLDDGWFGHRNDPTSSLGDWWPNTDKLPEGIDGLAGKIHALGLQFGLWFEPEMISKDSQLYRNHPDWLIGAPHRALTAQRDQYVLDMSRKEVVDYLFNAMAAMICSADLDYIKWDMNRNITEAFGNALPPDRQGELYHRYILGVYDLYQRLTTEFPDVLFESCASGGGRFDLGMMYYAPQAWTSDDTDAIERVLIQFGTSYGYPLSTMGAHVSAIPNHETGRVTPLSTRANIAFFGDLGYELDITQLSDSDLEDIRQQIAFYKKYRNVLQHGRLHRLISPYEGDHNTMAWQVTSDDQAVSVVGWFRILNPPNPALSRVRLAGLDPARQYTVNGDGHRYFGDELMNVGLYIPQTFDVVHHRGGGDFTSHIIVVNACNHTQPHSN